MAETVASFGAFAGVGPFAEAYFAESAVVPLENVEASAASFPVVVAYFGAYEQVKSCWAH